MEANTNPAIAEAVAVIMELSKDERIRHLAETRDKYYRDTEARWEYAYLKGYEDVQQEGWQERERDKAIDMDRSLLLGKDPVERVAKVTGLPLEEVKALASELPVDL